jgi:hypothetical protein
LTTSNPERKKIPRLNSNWNEIEGHPIGLVQFLPIVTKIQSCKILKTCKKIELGLDFLMKLADDENITEEWGTGNTRTLPQHT